MKQIGKEVLFIRTGPGNPRNGESAFARLKDGRIMFAYTEYYGNSHDDDATAHLCACFSGDEGESWTAPELIVEKDETAKNIMSPSLVRMNNGDLGILYLRNEIMPDGVPVCMPAFRRSADEGKTWSGQHICEIPEGYYCGVNDTALRLKSGRILYPASCHGLRYGGDTRQPGDVRFIYSDDDGASWSVLPAVLKTLYGDSVGFAEPGVYEHEDGTLWCWFRSPYGFQYHSHSSDGGVSWDPPEPNFCFTSPDSPMRVKRVGRYVAALFNPLPFSCTRDDAEAWGSPKRTPIVCSFSDNDGHSFGDRGRTSWNGQLRQFIDSSYLLETDLSESYCYPAVLETKDGLLVSYYHSGGTGFCLNCSKIVKICFDEITD